MFIMPKKFLIGIIKIYKKYFSQTLAAIIPGGCRYNPTCSEYSILVLEKHGILKGGLMSIWRIINCNPFGRFSPTSDLQKTTV